MMKCTVTASNRTPDTRRSHKVSLAFPNYGDESSLWRICSEFTLRPAHRRFSRQKCCAMHEWPQCESYTAALYGAAKVRKGPFMLVGARSFGRIAAMRLTAAVSPLCQMLRTARTSALHMVRNLLSVRHSSVEAHQSTSAYVCSDACRHDRRLGH